MKKSLFMGLALTTMSIVSMTGCGNSGSGGGQSDAVKIGILQPNHPALAAATSGFLSEIAANGISVNPIIRMPNAQGSDTDSLALDLVSQCDILLGVGTGVSQKLKGAVEEKGKEEKASLLFTAVTDPVAAGLIPSPENGSGFCCGTTDMNPIDEQIDLIKECIPDVDKVGIIYTSSELNSAKQAELAIERMQSTELGITPVVKTCTGSADIFTVASALADEDGLDAIYIPTDNVIAENPGAISSAVNGKGILVVCGEESMLKGCGSVTKSINYTELGRKTGKMAVQILKGLKNAKDIPLEGASAEECEYVMCLANAADAGIVLPDSVKNKCRNID